MAPGFLYTLAISLECRSLYAATVPQKYDFVFERI